MHPHLLLAPPKEKVHLLQLMNLNWYIIIIQNLEFSLPLKLGDVHSVCLVNILTYPLLWCHAEYFTTLKIVHALPMYTSSPICGSHWSFYCYHIFGFFIISYHWKHTACRLFRLASFTLWYTFNFLPCLIVAW